jgi:hypothetical protein
MFGSRASRPEEAVASEVTELSATDKIGRFNASAQQKGSRRGPAYAYNIKALRDR